MLGTSLSLLSTNSFGFSSEQTEDWQQEILAQVQRQTKAAQDAQPQQSKSTMSQERMNQILGQVRDIATVKGEFQLHQVQRYCQNEISSFCTSSSGDTPHLLKCLIKHKDRASKQCSKVLSDNNRAQPSLADEWRHDILIPAGSTYYVDPVDKSLGVNLSRPTRYMNIPIVGQLSWYEGGSIRSYVPSKTPVQYGQLVFAPNQEITLFPNGQIKRGVLHQPVTIGNLSFNAGQIITRDSDKQPFQSLK
ncbi:TPA: cysteine rich repeat-containing protein [Vibrio parahaemolyticus]|uniref:cysteine rich repeat-containing protein n=1 Tax=Vibrio parahaemolyticus TaxID=670 RepID=UPI001B842D4F|nr:cysteine rich repeat-containing protein [Vibrio parahaemolyticus]MDF5646688.1 cysteine rich repeat-containing protein [Vibrio parahaemolyticus]MDF5666053.1 cysteine rich repeat-containing protein [Vibrio parahaemolyticus]HBC3540453.1 cysteine rich repeat-containing protein [Vibrio parahaemolyticus]HBC3816841.1 cysteine rich repeat-containing protein [Vibrio parahaemolyticus]